MVRLSKETMYNEHPVDEASFQSASRWFYDSAITAAGGFPGRGRREEGFDDDDDGD